MMYTVFSYSNEHGYQMVGELSEAGFIYSADPGGSLRKVGHVNLSGIVSVLDSSGNLIPCCVVDLGGKIYKGMKCDSSQTTACVAGISDSMYGTGVFLCSNGKMLSEKIGSVASGASTLLAAGAAAVLLGLAGTNSAAVHKHRNSAAGTKTSNDQKKSSISSLGGGLLFWLAGGIGAALLYGYIGGLLFDHENTMRATASTAVIITYCITGALVLFVIAASIQAFLHRKHELSVKHFIMAFLAGLLMGPAWTVAASVVPSLITLGSNTNPTPNEIILVAGGFMIGFFGMLAKYLEEGK